MNNEAKMATSSEAIPMPYLVSETSQKTKKDEKVLNKSMKNKNRKRNKGNIIAEHDETQNV